jgi:hypothetical protein
VEETHLAVDLLEDTAVDRCDGKVAVEEEKKKGNNRGKDEKRTTRFELAEE